MSLLLPILTMVLVVIGALCLFIAIDNDRKLRMHAARKTPAAAPATQLGRTTAVAYAGTGYITGGSE